MTLLISSNDFLAQAIEGFVSQWNIFEMALGEKVFVLFLLRRLQFTIAHVYPPFSTDSYPTSTASSLRIAAYFSMIRLT